jgi:serpin B
MAQVLYFNLPQSQLHPAFNALDLALEKSPENFEENQQPMTLNLANAVWAEQTFPFQQDFLDTLALNYGAGIHLADFIDQYEPARKEINNWVSDQTQKKIQNLLPEGSVNTDTRMALVNAIYFKADWRSPFNASATSDAPFFLLDGSPVNVPTMHLTMSFPYIDSDGYQAVELEYAEETAAMDIIVPDAGTFEAFESSFNNGTYTSILTGMQSNTVQLGFPKFTFTKDFHLNTVLAELGMPAAFNRNTADFSGMTGQKILYIENIFHKAFVAVDEKGTEAAAATAILAVPASLPVVLEVNHPFLFIIRDTVHGQILFIGRVLDPVQN